MSEVAIQVEGLGKQYRIGQRERYHALRDVPGRLASGLGDGLRRLIGQGIQRPEQARQSREIWALKDVSFDVKRGEVVGVIGRNGAGKSTLLKILTRITDPTEGQVGIEGRVASLLEVGTGFHPELTGRENVFLNGAILGMSRAEIARKFDEIVAFAEVERFVDTPVKHYSSGMEMRLAFSVAAHLDPDILLVDEVLAVGDGAFQKKCIGKIGDVAAHGRTVLFVTHQMNQVRRLCSHAMWFSEGTLREMGTAEEVVGRYESTWASTALSSGLISDSTTSSATFVGWHLEQPGKPPGHAVLDHEPLIVHFQVKINRPLKHGTHQISLFSAEHQLLWTSAIHRIDLEPGHHALTYSLPSIPLRPGQYMWYARLDDDSGPLDISDLPPQLTIHTPLFTDPRDEYAGLLNFPYYFSIRTQGHLSEHFDVT
jgi:lipopolysaccharide transport system ATP-binding protein